MKKRKIISIESIQKSIYNKKRLIVSILLANMTMGLGLQTGELLYAKLKNSSSPRFIRFMDYISNSTTLYNKDDITLALCYNELSLNEVHNAIDNNNNIPNHIKNIAHYLVQKVYINYPNFDFRYFYENIQDLKVTTLSLEELRERFGLGVSAVYHINEDAIYISPNTTNTEICHELSHLFKSYYRSDNNSTIISYCYQGSSFNEAMNCEINSLVKPEYTYTKERAILYYFQNYINFDIQDYSDNSIYYLIELLENNYPTVNIRNIISSVDKENEYASLNGTSNYITEKELNELFKICILNIDSNNPYQSFNIFIRLFKHTDNEASLYTYFEDYNNILKESEIDIISTTKLNNALLPYQDIIGVLYNDTTIYPVTNYFNYEYTIINDNNEKENIKNNGYTYLSFTKNDLITIYLSNNSISYPEIINYLNSINPDYKEYNFYYNNGLVCSNTMDNIQIKIVLNEDNSIGYLIKNNINNYSHIYQYNINNIKYSSDFITLKDYIGPYINQNVNLNDFLNETYLKYLLLYSPNLFGNVFVDNNNIIINPRYILNIINQNNNLLSSDSIYNYYITSNGENLSFFNKNIIIEYPCSYNGVINMLDIFNFYNLLDDQNDNITYKDIEISSLIINYINDKYLNPTPEQTPNVKTLK